ncbi:GatB/YqeY domain-containing protein [Coralliovum pocilloporae]|uniref:GatB/YqeY domain-containing protein n=1 Tax=Coralliovum pocilloporae TaxID=3066369 RepID=UPI003306D4C2
MREKLNDSLKQAIKAKNQRRVSTLRLILAAIKDRDIANRSDNKDPVTDSDIQQILGKMIKQRNDSIKAYEEAGRLELAEQEKAEIDIIRDFLPKQMSEDEVRAVCSSAIETSGAQGLRDMGKCMAVLKEKYPGQMDFSKASAIVKELLK